MSVTLTGNYSFKKSNLGHPSRDTFNAENMDMIDAAIYAIATAKGITTLEMSFETDQETATKIYFPFAVKITKIRSIVMKALAATSAGTITGANSVGNSATGVVTIAAEAALNEEDSAVPTTNVAIAANSYYKLTSAKANKGGIVLVTLEYERTV